jgi:hypothetical protein
MDKRTNKVRRKRSVTAGTISVAAEKQRFGGLAGKI